MTDTKAEIVTTVLETFDREAIAAMYADEILRRDERFAAGRASGLRAAASYARSRSSENWGAASCSPSTILCTVSDELFEQAAQATRKAAAVPGSAGGDR